MNKQKAYKDKVDAEISEHSAKISALKAKIKSEAVDVKVASLEKIEELEKHLDQVKDKLSDMSDVAEGTWDAFKDRLDHSRKEISTSIKILFSEHDSSDEIKKE